VIYLDTNIVVALCVREGDSDRVEAALAMMETPFATSEWTRVEFTSAIGIKFRNRELSESLARRALADYYRALEPGLSVITPTREDYILAADYLQDLKSGLRSGDALHLAIAVNQKATRFLTLDKTFIEAAREVSLPVELLW
jgi:uncharacterized protein